MTGPSVVVGSVERTACGTFFTMHIKDHFMKRISRIVAEGVLLWICAVGAQNANGQNEDAVNRLRQLRETGESVLQVLTADFGYALSADRDIVRIPPPFPDQRQVYYLAAHPSQARAIPRGPDGMIFFEKEGKLRSWGMTFSGGPDRGYSLSTLLDTATGFKRHEILAPQEVLSMSVPGDWIIREGADPEKLAGQISDILTHEMKIAVKAEIRDVEREVFVATGNYQFTPVDGQEGTDVTITDRGTIRSDSLHIFGSQFDLDSGAGGGSGDLKEMLQWAGNYIHVPIVNDVAEPQPEKLSWRLHGHIDPAKEEGQLTVEQEATVANLAKQTGIQFEKTRRRVRTLVLEKQ
ncbi:MAG: hypothetical protein R3E01_14370 [Pirellulaceae bacterium]